MRQRGCFGFIVMGIIAMVAAAQLGFTVWS
jgi:hypothetical protein